MRVSLRKSKLKNDRYSLYLQVYHNKKTTYEFLKLYLEKSNASEKRKQNKETLKLAERIRAKRQVELQNGTYGFRLDNNIEDDFIKYFKKLTDRRQESGINHNHWLCTYKQLKKYTKNRKLMFSDVDEYWLEDFKNYLLRNLNQNTSHSYFNKIKACLHQAYREKIIYNNAGLNVKSPKLVDTHREYLTIEEIKSLLKTDCRSQVLKKAFLFSCFTGLRWSDINKLKWNDIKLDDDNKYYIIISQQKTKDVIRLPLSNQSINILGISKSINIEERVFKGLKYSSEMNIKLSQWVLKSGISKHITFHCARHTHATLLLSNGVDIYTVSKLLGHKEVRTTQVYTKVMDKNKRVAIEKLPSFM